MLLVMVTRDDCIMALLNEGGTSKPGLLFPALARIHHNHRAKMFIKRLKTVGVTGVSLHSYRYAWPGLNARRRLAIPNASPCRRWATAAHRDYAKKAQGKMPPLVTDISWN